MKKSERAHIVATVDGVPRELFFVKLKPSGDLLVVPRHETRIRHAPKGGATAPPVSHVHHSVHRSPSSLARGTTITHTTLTADGNRYSEAALVKDREQLQWLVFSKHCPDLRHPQYAMKKALGPVVSIASDVPLMSSLIFSLVVQAKARPVVQALPHSVTVLELGDFRLVVYSCFVDIPSSNAGFRAVMSTRSARKNGATRPDAEQLFERRYPDGAESISGEDFGPKLYAINNGLAHAAMQYLLSLLPEGSPWGPVLSRHRWTFTTWPITPGGPPVQMLPTPPSVSTAMIWAAAMFEEEPSSDV